MSESIFISYKRVDKERVFAIKDSIEKNVGEKCWIDLDGIESDAQFENVIINAINNAPIFLFMYSNSHTKIEDYEEDWTVKEISFAQKKKKRIVFINIDGTPLTDRFEFRFGTKQQIDASSDVLMEKLYEDIRKWLGNERENNVLQNDSSKDTKEKVTPPYSTTTNTQTDSQTLLPVIDGPELFTMGEQIEITVKNPVKKAVWEIHCGSHCLYKSKEYINERVMKLFDSNKKFRFIMNRNVSNSDIYKTKKITVRYYDIDNLNLSAEITIETVSNKPASMVTILKNIY